MDFNVLLASSVSLSTTLGSSFFTTFSTILNLLKKAPVYMTDLTLGCFLANLSKISRYLSQLLPKSQAIFSGNAILYNPLILYTLFMLLIKNFILLLYESKEKNGFCGNICTNMLITYCSYFKGSPKILK